MHLAALAFPEFDPVAIALGPFVVRWYALAYLVGILFGWWLARRYARNEALWGGASPIRPIDIDDLVVWVAVGIVLGGRLGYVLFYNPAHYLQNPLEALALWSGGMSFHGGLVGSALATYLFARTRGIPVLSLMDVCCAVCTVGIFLGRLANFVNGELWGRPTDVPWAFVFPGAGPEPRHPSQLYEAALEGLLLFVVLNLMISMGALRRPGLVGGTFLALYAVARMTVEQFRMPDEQIGFLFGGLTMGLLLSVPMLLVGLALIGLSLRHRRRPA
jgi:phosphatidylglycerol:prolipoprotein diacylglycerol transferase